MIRISVVLFALTIGLIACNGVEQKGDLETNAYYFEFKKIYDQQDSIGVEQTLVNIENYLEEFPQNIDAYMLKGYLLGQEGDRAESAKAYEKALEMDSTKIEIYEYWTAFLLLDSNDYEKAAKYISLGLNQSDSSAVLYNSSAWLAIFDNNGLKAENEVLKAIALDSTKAKYYRTLAIAQHINMNFENRDSTLSIAKTKGLTKENILLDYLNDSISVVELYKKL